MTTEIVRVTDDTSRDEIELALTNYAKHARRQMHHLDCAAWNKAHEGIDALLDDWLRADA